MTFPSQASAAGAVAFAALVAFSAATAAAETRMEVGVEDGIRRTCPSIDCGSIGRFFRGESIIVYEIVDGWSRVSLYYGAGCYDGISSYIEAGPAACTEANGIRNGEFAEWIRSDSLIAEGGGHEG